MKIIFGILFLSLMAFAQNVETINGGSATIFEYISSPHTEFKNKFCVQYGIRQMVTDHDLLLASGFKISSIKKEFVVREDGVEFYEFTMTYADQQGNVASRENTFDFRCQLLKQKQKLTQVL